MGFIETEWILLALAALGGACVFAMIQPDRQSWLRSFASIAVGFKASVWITPALCEWQGWQSVHLQHAVAFGIGLLGNPLCRMILSEGSAEMARTIKEAIGRLFNRNGRDDEPRIPRERMPRPDSDPPV